MSTRSPARLIVALGVAAVLAVFLLYTAVAGHSTPTVTPSELASHSGRLAVVGVVVAPLHGDSHSAAGLRFGLKNIDGKSGVVPVVYRGENPPPLFKVGRNVVVSGSYAHGKLAGNNVVTKCPSKYTATKSA
ncbi:MAG TPA: cytochrome c maturation protein CcmE [Gaiellaceae bacterium]|nr:cytochrome c maturation protein CcmE [Gaiellaceae bacterium]